MTYYTKYLMGESVWPLFDLGEWASLLQTAGEIFDWDRTSYQALLALPYVAHVHFLRGDVAGADLLREEFLRRAHQSADPQVLIPALAISGLIDSELGDDQAARAAIEEIELVTRNRPVRRAQHLPDALRVCAAAGAVDLAERLVESTEVTAARQRHAVHTARAILTEAQGQLEESLGRYEQAAARWAAYGFVLEHARALLGAGRCLDALGRGDEAAAPLRSAQVVFKSLDAKPLLAETEALLDESEATAV
jgi:tetratricopeptide (TPR) repeat protein